MRSNNSRERRERKRERKGAENSQAERAQESAQESVLEQDEEDSVLDSASESLEEQDEEDEVREKIEKCWQEEGEEESTQESMSESAPEREEEVGAWESLSEREETEEGGAEVEAETQLQEEEREDLLAWMELQSEQEQDPEKELLGGKLMLPEHLSYWRDIGCEGLVKDGCQPDWIHHPPPRPRDYTRRECYIGEMHDCMLAAINAEVARGVLQIIPKEQAFYVLPVFVVRKPGKDRLILDCRELNVYIKEKHFKLSDWLVLRDNIQPGCGGVTLDFSSGFHHLGLSDELQQYLVFRYAGVYYRYVGLPFGLRSAPRLFCAAITATVNAIRMRWGLVAVAYMDDLCIMAADRDELRKAVLEIVQFCENLGWTINKEKSKMEPSTTWVYLGLEWNTVTMTVQKTTEKNTALKKTVKDHIHQAEAGAVVRVRELARLIGQLSATRPQHDEASLYLAKANRLKCQAVRSGGWEAKVTLTRALLPELHWWLRKLRENTPNSIRPFEAATTIYTDASENGWGATVRRLTNRTRWMFGWWHGKEAEVNCMRELKAVILAVERALKKRIIIEGEDIQIFTDNSNVEFNLNKKRAGWRMRPAVKAFVQWLKERRLRLRCIHVKGERNVTADALSRLSKSGDYHLKASQLQRIEKAFGVKAEVDLFATKRNRQCQRYSTVETIEPNDNDAIARDAMSIPWTGWTALIHPPIPLLSRCLSKIRNNNTTAILLCPRWRGAPWTASLRNMTVKGPMVLGKAAEVLVAGPTMAETNSSLPPGLYEASLVQGRPSPH
jgi:hypothetical protein